MSFKLEMMMIIVKMWFTIYQIWVIGINLIWFAQKNKKTKKTKRKKQIELMLRLCAARFELMSDLAYLLSEFKIVIVFFKFKLQTKQSRRPSYIILDYCLSCSRNCELEQHDQFLENCSSIFSSNLIIKLCSLHNSLGFDLPNKFI